MGGEWKQYRLGDITKWKSGGTPPKADDACWGGDIPWISASSMDGNRYRDSKLKVTELGLNSGTRLASKDSILLLVRGSILHQKIQVGIAEREVAFNQDVKALNVNEDILEPWYLLLWFMSKERALLGMVENTGIGAGKLDTKVLQNLFVDIPPKKERKRILEFAKAFDDKLELNRQMNATLEAMSQALFKSWFVDFDPVIDNALAAGNPVPEPLYVRAETRKALSDKSKPLPEAIQKQFPSSFVFSEEMGWVPEGWAVVSLSKMMNIKGGTQPPSNVFIDEPREGYVRLVQIRDYGTDSHITYIPDAKNLRKTSPMDIMIARYGAAVGRILWGMTGAYNVALIKVELHLQNTREYLRTYLQSQVFQERLLGMSGRSAQAGFNKSDISSFRVVLPDTNLLKLYEDTCLPNRLKGLELFNENICLSKLRETLMLKLLSNQLRIPDAEKLVEDAV